MNKINDWHRESVILMNLNFNVICLGKINIEIDDN